MKPLKLNPKRLSLLILTCFYSVCSFAQLQSYFRTTGNGSYTNAALWEASLDSVTWVTTSSIPDKSVTSIEIRNAITDTRSATAATVLNLTISSSGSYTAPITLSVYGNLVCNGTFKSISISSTVKFINTSKKTISGTTPIYFNNFTVMDGSSVKMLSSQYVKRLVSVGSNALLNTGDSLTLLSSMAGTAGIGTLANGADVIGKVHYERYIPGGSSHRKWRFMAMPIQGQTFANSWQKDIYITGPGINGQDCGTTGNMIPNSAGFDQNQTGMNHPTDTA